MDLSIEQIKHLAKLSKIALSREEEQKYAQQLGSILSFLDTLTLEEKEGTPTEWEERSIFLQNKTTIQIHHLSYKIPNILSNKTQSLSKHHSPTNFSFLFS